MRLRKTLTGTLCVCVLYYICASRVTQPLWVEGFLSRTATVRSPQICSARRPAAPRQRTAWTPMTTTSLLVRTHFHSRYVRLHFSTQPAQILYAWLVRCAGWWRASDAPKSSQFSVFKRHVCFFLFSSFTEAHVGVSTRKPGNSEPKEVNTSSFTQSPAGMQPTSLEQVQTLLTNKQKWPC